MRALCVEKRFSGIEVPASLDQREQGKEEQSVDEKWEMEQLDVRKVEKVKELCRTFRAVDCVSDAAALCVLKHYCPRVAAEMTRRVEKCWKLSKTQLQRLKLDLEVFRK